MSLKDPYLQNVNLDLHLRDARHAHQLFNEHNLALAPKTKFLYHVLFTPMPEVGNSANSNTFKFQKEIGVLVKSADLPSYRISVENKQQYNRKKNVQTRIDYQDVNIVLHDDNTGITRGMLEEYYRYYFNDGNNQAFNGAYDARDKYKNGSIPVYGMNTGIRGPFFNSITIYQLSRRNWYAYTLVNPLISAWNHGNVDSSSGADMNSNSITLAYEAVMYTHGIIGDRGEPGGFTDDATRYDNVMSPLGYADKNMIDAAYASADPALVDERRNVDNFVVPRMTNSSNNSPLAGIFGIFNQLPGGLTNTSVPTVDSQANTSTSRINNVSTSNKGVSAITDAFTTNLSALKSFAAKALNAGAGGVSYAEYNAASPAVQSQIEQQLTADTANNAKLQNFANEAINASK